MQDREDRDAQGVPQDGGRRKAMKKLAVGAGALAGYSMLPGEWTRPIVGLVALPAHAATSGVVLHDPCTAMVTDGDQTTETVTVSVEGYVSPPVANLAALIVVDTLNTIAVTGPDGHFAGEITVSGGPGLDTISVITSVSNVDGVSNCTVQVPAPAPPPQAEAEAPQAEPAQKAAAEPAQTKSASSGDGEFNAKEVFPLRWMSAHNRAFTWLNKTGAAYGGPIKFVFNNGCGELYVANPADDFNRAHPSAAVYFCGTRNKPEESNGNKSSIFGPTGCRASQVTLYYNR